MSSAQPDPAADVEMPAATAVREHRSSMVQRLGWLHRRLSAYAFALVHVDPKAADRVRGLAVQSNVVYVVRHRSVADYLLVRWVLAREGLPLPEFANDLGIGWFRPLRWMAGRIVKRLARLQLFGQGKRQRIADREAASRLAAAGRPILVFLRSRSAGLRGTLRHGQAAESIRIGDPYLADLFGVTGARPIAVVPLAIFRGRGYRRRTSRLATLVYSVQEAPGELKKLLTFLFNRADLTLTIGEAIDLEQFRERYGRERPTAMARRLARTLQLFLYREERVVWGPPLVPKDVVRDVVMSQPGIQPAIERIAAERGASVAKVRREAVGYFDEIASNFNGGYFAILAFLFHRLWKRIFRGVEITGLDRVAETIRQHPVVLVPCHRSHFDYLILTYIFHSHFLSPPHIAAGINLAFFPLGPLFRGAGAYFIRRSFGDNELYKEVFRQYLAYLIREGYTQEFFIEGGRSRSGKILTPKLGMLSAIVDAFLGGARRDLYLVPVSISYERLVEEEAYKRELLGGEKEKETLSALVRARSVLRTNYGKAFVSFAEPISLAESLGSLRARLRDTPDEPGIEEEKRRFTLKLGFRILEQVNEASVLSAPSVAATVLLSHPHQAIRVGDFVRAARALLEHALWAGAAPSDSLRRDAEGFREMRAFLETTGMVVRIHGGDNTILHVPDDKRVNLDFHKNNSIHWYVLLSLLAHALARGVAREALQADLAWWLDLFRNEFVLPDRERLGDRLERLLDRLRVEGAVVGEGREAVRREHPLLEAAAPILQNFREAYWVAARTIRLVEPAGTTPKALVEEMGRNYRAHLLLGVLRKPEGNTVVTLRNALERMREFGYVRFEGGDERAEPRAFRGPAHGDVVRVEERLASSLTLAER